MKETIIRQVEAKELHVSQGAALLGMTRQGFLKLRKQYRRHGLRALSGLKRGPKRWHCPANKTEREIEEAVVAYRQCHPTEGPKTILWRMKDEQGIELPEITIARILRRNGLVKPRVRTKTKREWGEVTVSFPGERLQLDTYQPWGRCGKIVFEAVDVFSRWTLGWVCEAATMENAARFVDMLIERSPFPIRCIQPDNGSEFQSLFVQALAKYGIVFDPIPPYAPNCNGRVERGHKSSKYELYWTLPHTILSLEEINYAATLYYQDFNWKRRHQGRGMNMMTPAEKLISYLTEKSGNVKIFYGNLTLI